MTIYLIRSLCVVSTVIRLLAVVSERSHMFCMACGAAIPDGGRFCARCGAAAGTVPQPGSTPAMSPASNRSHRRWKYLLAAAIVLVLAAAMVTTIVAVTRGGSNAVPSTGATPWRDPNGADALPSGARSAPTVRWHRTTAFPASIPAVVGSRLLVQSGRWNNGQSDPGTTLAAYTLATGQPLWSLHSPEIFSYVPVGSDRLLVILGDSFERPSTLKMINMADGRVEWQKPGGDSRYVNVFGRYLVVNLMHANANAGVEVLDVATGATRWSRTGRSFWRTSSVTPDTLYEKDGTTVRAVDTVSGSVRNSVVLNSPETQISAIIPGNPPVIVTSRSANDLTTLSGYSIRDLHLLWTRTGPDSINPGDLSMLLSFTQTGSVHRLDPATGRELWSYAAPAATNPSARVAVSGDLVLVNTHGDDENERMDALDASTGARRWTVNLPAANGCSVDVSRDVTYEFCAVNGASAQWQMHGLDTASGNELWSLPMPHPVYARDPQPADRGLVVAVDDGLQLMTA
jgi:outer membrane protein assembly factor BamB